MTAPYSDRKCGRLSFSFSRAASHPRRGNHRGRIDAITTRDAGIHPLIVCRPGEPSPESGRLGVPGRDRLDERTLCGNRLCGSPCVSDGTGFPGLHVHEELARHEGGRRSARGLPVLSPGRGPGCPSEALCVEAIGRRRFPDANDLSPTMDVEVTDGVDDFEALRFFRYASVARRDAGSYGQSAAHLHAPRSGVARRDGVCGVSAMGRELGRRMPCYPGGLALLGFVAVLEHRKRRGDPRCRGPRRSEPLAGQPSCAQSVAIE